MLRNRLKQRQRLQFGKVGLWLQLGLNSKSVLEVLTATIPGNVLQQPYEPCSTTNPSYKKDHPCGNLILLNQSPNFKGSNVRSDSLGFLLPSPLTTTHSAKGAMVERGGGGEVMKPLRGSQEGPRRWTRIFRSPHISSGKEWTLLVGPSWLILRIPCEISPQLEDKSGKE